MRRKEFLRTSISMIGRMLDAHKEMTQNLFHWPQAKLGSILLEVNRNPKYKPEPFTVCDVMPHLGAAKEPEDEAQQMQMRSRAMFYQMANMPGVVREIEPS